MYEGIINYYIILKSNKIDCIILYKYINKFIDCNNFFYEII